MAKGRQSERIHTNPENFPSLSFLESSREVTQILWEIRQVLKELGLREIRYDSQAEAYTDKLFCGRRKEPVMIDRMKARFESNPSDHLEDIEHDTEIVKVIVRGMGEIQTRIHGILNKWNIINASINSGSISYLFCPKTKAGPRKSSEVTRLH